MENQTTSTSVPVEQPQVLSPQPSQLLSAPPLSSVSPSQQLQAAQQDASPMRFLMGLVDRLVPNSQQHPSTLSNPYPVAQASSMMEAQTPPQAIAPQTSETQTDAPWAGTPELSQFLEENGVSSMQDLLQYTAGQEQTAEQFQEIFEYALHPDPEIRQQFWTNYQQALQEQDTPEGQQLQQQQAPSLPGTPDNLGYYPPARQGFNSLEQFAQQHALMGSGLPGITPQQLADFDRAILMTPGQFWAQHIFDLGEI